MYRQICIGEKLKKGFPKLMRGDGFTALTKTGNFLYNKNFIGNYQPARDGFKSDKNIKMILIDKKIQLFFKVPQPCKYKWVKVLIEKAFAVPLYLYIEVNKWHA